MRNVRHLTLSVLACVALVCLLSLSSATAWARVGRIDEFSIPTSGSDPFGITAGPDGNLWFTEVRGNNIGRITPAGGFAEFPLLTNCNFFGCRPLDITVGPHARLWFTEEGGDNIGRITTK